jgi:hypothetical protein
LNRSIIPEKKGKRKKKKKYFILKIKTKQKSQNKKRSQLVNKFHLYILNHIAEETNLLSWSLIKAISAIRFLFKIFVLLFFNLLKLEEEELVRANLFFSVLFLGFDLELDDVCWPFVIEMVFALVVGSPGILLQTFYYLEIVDLNFSLLV